ncbi:MAG: binding-protein-dependent transport system inner rane component [Firmicutes bacterium]|nr:binding-protein-dependent transport system inner rane component [Bacillota bacterium]
MRRIGINQKAAVGILLLLLVAFMALLAPLVAPHDPTLQNTAMRLKPPGTPGYLLGTDPLGRDILSRIIYGSRISLIVGLASVVVAGAVGITLGTIAGYIGGTVDAVIMRLADLQLAIPFLVLALAIAAVLGPSLRNVILVLGVTGWVTYARVARGQVLSVRGREFVEAARALGATNGRIIWRHVLPELWAPLIVIASLQVGSMILAEASLSFFGLGVPPSIPTWGRIAADGRDYVTTSWWVATLPGIAIFLTVLGINLLGDWLRDRMDPTLRG